MILELPPFTKTMLPPLEEPCFPAPKKADDITTILPLPPPELPTVPIFIEPTLKKKTKAVVPKISVKKASKRKVVDLTSSSSPASVSTVLSPPSQPSKKITLFYKAANKAKKSGKLSVEDYLKPRRQTRSMTKMKLEGDNWEDNLEMEKLMAALAKN